MSTSYNFVNVIHQSNLMWSIICSMYADLCIEMIFLIYSDIHCLYNGQSITMGKEQLIGTVSTVKITFTDNGIHHKGSDEMAGDDFSGTKISTNGCNFMPAPSLFKTYPFLLPSLICIGVIVVFAIIYIIVSFNKKKKARILRIMQQRPPPVPTYTDQPSSINIPSAPSSIPSLPLYDHSTTPMGNSIPSNNSSFPIMLNNPLSL